MLRQFSVENFRSFRKQATLFMEAEEKLKGMERTNLFTAPNGDKLLNTAAIYGANASGKSNLVKALRYMQDMVMHSSKDTQKGEPIEVEPFLLDPKSAQEPSLFELIFFIGNVEYTYGFKVTKEAIIEEWLFRRKKRQTRLFERNADGVYYINKAAFKEGLGLKKRTRENALFLSLVAQMDGRIAGDVVKYFGRLIIIDGFNPASFKGITFSLHQKGTFSEEINNFLCGLDLGIKNLTYNKTLLDENQFEQFFKAGLQAGKLEFSHDGKTGKIGVTSINTVHEIEGQKQVHFDLEKHESHGTQKLYALAGPILKTLAEGRVLVIDEIDARLHPLITMELLRLFRTDKMNKNNAQLIVTTHDSNLLNRRTNLFRRDQILFTEKRQDQSSDLYSLAEFSPRKDEALDLNYLRGKYGAIPFLGGFAGGDSCNE